MHTSSKNRKNVFFLSGMFAGGWIWDRARRHIGDEANPCSMDEPLCYLGDNLDDLCRRIGPRIERMHGPVSLVGNSLGSLLGLELAARMPGKISSVVISGAPGFGHFTVDLKLRKSNPRAMKQNLVEVICHDRARADSADFDRIVNSFAEKFRSIIRLANQCNKTAVGPILENVRCPVYAIWGRNDLMTPFDKVEPALATHNIETHVIENCGHSPMYERPEEFVSKFNLCLF